MNEAYMVTMYNEADAAFGFDPGPVTIIANCTKAFAKSYARHMNKISPCFVSYFVEREPERWV